MTHIKLDNPDESVRKFVLAATRDPNGSVIEINGQPVAVVVPTSPPANGEEEWTEAKNQRRCDLIHREYTSGLTPAEAVELARLQDAALRHRDRVAPLPLEESRRLYEELLNKAASKPTKDE